MKRKLMELAYNEEYEQAISLCKEIIADLNSQDEIYWRTQLGYLYFLNYQNNFIDFYVNAPSVFQHLVEDFPTDANSRFWLGYINIIAFEYVAVAKKHLHITLELAPKHPYASLILSAYYGRIQQETYFRNTLKQQPSNFRALSELLSLFEKENQESDMKTVLDTIVSTQAYEEKHYGVMNSYINELFTFFDKQSKIKEQANLQLQFLDKDH
jgi:hypothetical protein